MSAPGPEQRRTVELGASLRAFVLGRVTPGSRVGVVGGGVELAGALASAGCAVWTGSLAEGEALQRFAPTHVVLGEGVRSDVLEGSLRTLSALVPEAELLLGFVNAGAAGALLATLTEGAPAREGLSDVAFLRQLSAWGLRVVRREALAAPVRQGSLAVDTAQAIQQLLTQLAPGAGDEGVLYALARAPTEAPSASREPGLLSLVLWCGPEQRDLLDEAVFSIVCQRYRPFELILVEPEGSEGAPGDSVRVLETYRRIADFSFQRVSGPPGGLMQEAIRRARGQYLAFFEASGLVYPGHFEKLIQALREGQAAWAVSRAFRRVVRTTPGGEEYIEAKIPFPLGDHLELAHWREHPWLFHVLVIDRERIAGFPLQVPDPSQGWAPALPLRLAAVFEPVFLNGLSTCEQRQPQDAVPALEPGTEALQVLRPLSALEQAMARAREAARGPQGLRKLAVAAVNARLKRWAPGVHRALRSQVSRWLK